jgi:hypothetical protein
VYSEVERKNKYLIHRLPCMHPLLTCCVVVVVVVVVVVAAAAVVAVFM